MSILQGDALTILKTMDSESIDCVVTSPPYFGLRDYGADGQIGREKTADEYVWRLVEVFDEIKRVLKPTGTCWVNLGESYDDKKQLLQVPARFALAMASRGWILRNEIIWHKTNAMPNSHKDRFTLDYEKLYFFVRHPRYYFEQQLEPAKPDSIARAKRGISDKGKWKNGAPGQNGHTMNQYRPNDKSREVSIHRNKRTVWSIANHPFKGAHFAVFPEQLVETPIKAGCPEGGTVLDPFIGSGTTAIVAEKLGRKWIGIELNPEYATDAEARIKKAALLGERAAAHGVGLLAGKGQV